MTTQRTWGGRFKGTLADAMLRLSASVDVDRALAEDDIRGLDRPRPRARSAPASSRQTSSPR